MTFKGLLDSIIDGSFFQAPQPPGATGLGGDLTPLPMLTGNAPVAGPNLLQHFGAAPPAPDVSQWQSPPATGINPNPPAMPGAAGMSGLGLAPPTFTGNVPVAGPNLLQHFGAVPPAPDASMWRGNPPNGVDLLPPPPQVLPWQDNSAQRSDVQAIARNPTVAGDIAQAWKNSNPGLTSTEQGGWIRQNWKGDMWTEPFPGNGSSVYNSVESGDKPETQWPFGLRGLADQWLGNRTIGEFHTHPWNAGPSDEGNGRGDMPQVNKNQIPGIIQSPDRQYYYGPPRPGLPPPPPWEKLKQWFGS